MYTTVFYLAGLRLSTVFCTLMQAGVQSSKPKAAIFVLLPYMQIHSQSSEVIITLKNLSHYIWCSQYLFKSFSASSDSMAAVISINLKLDFHMAVEFNKV